MASTQVGTGTNGILELQGTEVGTSQSGNWSDVAWALILRENGGSNLAYNSGIGASVSANYNGVDQGFVWTGNFAYDWRSGGNQDLIIASGTIRVGHRADGTADIHLFGHINATGSASAGGPTDVDVWVPWTKLVSTPDQPTGLTATRVSDTQANLSWNQTVSASNGAPTNDDINVKVNNGAFGNGITISAATSTSRSIAANQKLEYQVRSWNSAGWSAWSDTSDPIYTTPGAPTNTTATKNAALDIVISFTENVAYDEYNHQIYHGTVTGGTTTWDATAEATLASGVTSWTDTAPDAGLVHVYRVRAKAGSLYSTYDTSDPVQLLAAPNKPTVPDMANAWNKALALPYTWTHNPVDSSPQRKYEFSSSVDGGTTWTSAGIVTSTASTKTIAASTYAANVALTMRVRTWGSATTGGADGTGASAWSDLNTVTFKTIPVAAITVPATGATLSTSAMKVTLTFTQAESATFVTSQLQLLEGSTLRETLNSNVLVGIKMATVLNNGSTYSVKARVQDSNGLWSNWVTSTITVTYLAPVPAVVTTTFLPDTGYGQIGLTIAAPNSSQSASTLVTITRTIDGVVETLVTDYPAAAVMTFLDTTATVNGTNTYKVTTKTALGASVTVTKTLVTTECRRAYLSKGSNYSNVVVFGGNLSVDESLSVASDTIQAAGRIKPVGLYGVETTVQLKVQSYIFENFGSPIGDLRDILLLPGKACYRDPSGRRLFGSVKGSISYKKVNRGDLSFTITETS